MTKRAAKFVEEWVRKNVAAQSHVDENDDDPRPEILAEQCAAEAAEAGIPREEIDEAFGQLFEDRIAEAIDTVADIEVDRLAAEDEDAPRP